MVLETPVKTTQDIPSRLSLLDLPAEIRLLIYEQCVPKGSGIYFDHNLYAPRWELRTASAFDGRMINLMKTCQLIRTEATAVLYSRTRFVLEFNLDLANMQKADHCGSVCPFSLNNIDVALVKHVKIRSHALECEGKDSRVHMEDLLEAILPTLEWGRNLSSLTWRSYFYDRPHDKTASPTLLQTWRKIQFQGRVKLRLREAHFYPFRPNRRTKRDYDLPTLQQRLIGKSHESRWWCLTDRFMNRGGIEALR